MGECSILQMISNMVGQFSLQCVAQPTSLDQSNAGVMLSQPDKDFHVIKGSKWVKTTRGHGDTPGVSYYFQLGPGHWIFFTLKK